MSSAHDADVELPKLERAWMEAWRLKDRATCERLIADDFVLTGGGATWDGAFG